jgi:hypothetical protein
MMGDVRITDAPNWVKVYYNPENGCREYVPDSMWNGRSESGYSMVKHSGNDADADLWNDPRWRHENLSLEGIAMQYSKHAEGTQLSHPMAWVLGFQSPINGVAYASNRSETWGIPQGMQNVASPNLMASIDTLYAAHSDALWDMLVPIKDLPLNTPRTFFWMTQIYEPTMAIPTTQRGMPTVVDALQRTGVARVDTFKIEGEVFINFWKTQMGTEHFNAVLSTMARGMVLASQYGAAVKLADADYEYMEIMKRENKFLPTLDFVADRQAAFFAHLQRANHTNFSKLRSIFDNMLFSQRAKRGQYMFVMTKLTWDVMTKFNEHAMKHDIMSERGLDLLESHATELMTILSDKVAVIPPFMLQKGLNSNPFEHPIEISEYIKMFDDAKGMNTMMRDRMIFDQETGFKEVTSETALKHLYIWDTNGAPIAKPNSFDAARWPLSRSYYPYTDKTVNPLELWTKDDEDHVKEEIMNAVAINDKMAAAGWVVAQARTFALDDIELRGRDGKAPTTIPQAFTDAKNLRDRLIAAHKANYIIPMNILILQPHQRYMAQDCLYMLPGSVAVRVKKQGEAMVQDVNRDFIHRVTVQVPLGCANEMPQNLVKAPAVVISQYLGGCGVKPMKFDNNYNPREYKYNGDLIFLPVPRDWEAPRNINLHGTMATLQQIYGHPEDPLANWYPGCALLNTKTHWVEMQTGIPSKRLWPRETFRVVRDPISCVARCATYLHRDTQGTYNWIHEGKGYWQLDGTYQTATKDRILGTFEKVPSRSNPYAFV